jgi:hypothetical protein
VPGGVGVGIGVIRKFRTHSPPHFLRKFIRFFQQAHECLELACLAGIG